MWVLGTNTRLRSGASSCQPYTSRYRKSRTTSHHRYLVLKYLLSLHGSILSQPFHVLDPSESRRFVSNNIRVQILRLIFITSHFPSSLGLWPRIFSFHSATSSCSSQDIKFVLLHPKNKQLTNIGVPDKCCDRISRRLFSHRPICQIKIKHLRIAFRFR